MGVRIRRAALLAAPLFAAALAAGEKPGFRDTPMLPDNRWRVHDADRPQPPVVTPAADPGAPPSDAIVLFNGGSLAAWSSPHGPWTVKDGALIVPPKADGAPENALSTRQGFGDIQLHLEFRQPLPDGKTGQERGNSGIWFMQRYEVQILDSYHNHTYADGTLGAIYGWKPPLANVARPPGAWQSFDIVFERPRFAADGKLISPAYVTVFLNNILVQNHQPMLGTTAWRKVATYTPHADSAPLQLQDHGSPVAFRNIWVRPLAPEATGATDP